MDPLLSIFVPTYNRPDDLLRSLSFLSTERFDKSAVKICVADNASLKTLPRDQLQAALADCGASYLRREKNIGIIGNYRNCIDEAEGKYVWLMGDADRLQAGLVENVVQCLKSHEDLALVQIQHEYEHEKPYFEARSLPGEFRYYETGVGFLREKFLYARLTKFTASVFRKTIAQQAIRDWDDLYPRDADNYALPLFVTVTAACRGSVGYLPDAWFWCHDSKYTWSAEANRFRCYDLPKAILACKHILHDRALIDRTLEGYFSHFRTYPVRQAIKALFRGETGWETVAKLLYPLTCKQWYRSQIARGFRL